MNKLTKVGLSALCGSLASIAAANAGDLTVSGGVDMSWISLDDASTGNPIGIGTNLTFKGAGELDNGWAFDIAIAHKNDDSFSAGVVTIDTGSFGKLEINQGDTSNGVAAMDDKMPTAWEESWGNGLGTGIDLVTGGAASMNIEYTTPTILGTTINLMWAPEFGASDTADKTTGTNASGADTVGDSYDATININPSLGTEILSGLDLFVGAHYHEIYSTDTQINDENDWYEGVAGITYSLGPVSIGFARSGELHGNTTTASDVDYYRNNMYGVAFNINDNLSISYGRHESEINFVNPNDNEARSMEVESYQIAYSMGGASFRIAESEVDNASYQTGTGYDKEATVISMSLAF